MKHLYAPWRGSYTKKAADQTHLKHGCPFCTIIESKNDAENYVIKRYASCTVLLNTFPYNPGHLLIIPNAHLPQLHDLDDATRHELMDVITSSTRILTDALACHGTNVGINLGGEAAGGSIPEHLHVHVVPRWKGDTNFMPVIAETKQISEDLNTVYAALKTKF